MGKPKCANCGGEMLELYSRCGLQTFICGHIKPDVTTRISGMPLYNAIYCDQKRARDLKVGFW